MIYFINIELVYIDSYDIKERVYYLTIDKSTIFSCLSNNERLAEKISKPEIADT